MKKTLYEILGVKPKASNSDIKKAHRKLVQKHHPDVKGGNTEKFLSIDMAYKILRDADRRKLYDQTGEVDSKSALSEMDLVRAVMADIYTQLLSSGVAFNSNISVIDTIKKMVKANCENFEAETGGCEASIESLCKLRKTISVEDGKENIFAQITDEQIKKLEARKKDLTGQIHIGSMVLDELQSYKSFASAANTVHMWTSATASGWS